MKGKKNTWPSFSWHDVLSQGKKGQQLYYTCFRDTFSIGCERAVREHLPNGWNSEWCSMSYSLLRKQSGQRWEQQRLIHSGERSGKLVRALENKSSETRKCGAGRWTYGIRCEMWSVTFLLCGHTHQKHPHGRWPGQLMQPIKKQRHYLANKHPSSQTMVF